MEYYRQLLVRSGKPKNLRLSAVNPFYVRAKYRAYYVSIRVCVATRHHKITRILSLISDIVNSIKTLFLRIKITFRKIINTIKNEHNIRRHAVILKRSFTRPIRWKILVQYRKHVDNFGIKRCTQLFDITFTDENK